MDLSDLPSCLCGNAACADACDDIFGLLCAPVAEHLELSHGGAATLSPGVPPPPDVGHDRAGGDDALDSTVRNALSDSASPPFVPMQVDHADAVMTVTSVEPTVDQARSR